MFLSAKNLPTRCGVWTVTPFSWAMAIIFDMRHPISCVAGLVILGETVTSWIFNLQVSNACWFNFRCFFPFDFQDFFLTEAHPLTCGPLGFFDFLLFYVLRYEVMMFFYANFSFSLGSIFISKKYLAWFVMVYFFRPLFFIFSDAFSSGMEYCSDVDIIFFWFSILSYTKVCWFWLRLYPCICSFQFLARCRLFPCVLLNSL